MPTPFESFDAKRAKNLLDGAMSDHAKTNRLFYDGDHWQSTAGWIGPFPKANESGYSEAENEVLRVFSSANKVAEVCERHSEGVSGREPRFGLVPRRPLRDDEEPNEQEQAAIDEAEAMLTEWWNEQGVHELLLEAIANLLWARRGPLRLYIPQSVIGKDGTVSFASVAEAMRAVYVDVPPPEDATVYVDPATKAEFAIFRFKEKVDEKDVEVIEASYLLENAGEIRETMISQFRGTSREDFPLNFGGRLPMYEMRRRREFITPQVQQNQRALNMALTMVPRTAVTAGFLRMLLLNAQMPGHYEPDPENPGGRGKFVEDKFSTGAGVTNFVQGTEGTDTNGNITTASPSAVIVPPVTPDGAIRSIAQHYTAILEECKQSHVLMNVDATASGLSRVEARSDYHNSLRKTVPIVERCGRWLIETALAMAELLAGKPGQYTSKLRCDFNCRLSLGVLSSQDRAENVTEVQAGVLPVEYAMSDAGVDDVDAAQALINSRPESQLGVLKQRADVFRTFIDAGLDFAVAAELAGFDEEEIALIGKPQDPTGGNPQPANPPIPFPPARPIAQ